ncbi:DUF4131 domain-containing protein [Parafrankia sp. BMG5.11]|uniref:DUF4131 domain-containing protein n=1 Tax=Parafrankia sp. BMG5.11 TaxID=222540 RepID=UPI001A9D1634|nr:DUF4131 domain-containing protein [Parafrankia sp. BMG5.11]
MATRAAVIVPIVDDPGDVALQQHWRKAWSLSSLAGGADAWLDRAGFDRAPWLATALAGGIVAWFALPSPIAWIVAMAGCILLASATVALTRPGDDYVHLRRAVVAVALLISAGIALVWIRSVVIGAEPIARPQVIWLEGKVLERENQPAQQRVRLTLAYRDAEAGLARKVRVNVAPDDLDPGIAEGAHVRLRARLMPPAPPMAPGAYNFARAAWFAGLSATGTAIGPVQLIGSATPGGTLARRATHLVRPRALAARRLRRRHRRGICQRRPWRNLGRGR